MLDVFAPRGPAPPRSSLPSPLSTRVAPGRIAAALLVLIAAKPLCANDFLLGGIQVNEPSLDAWVEALDDADLDAVAVTNYAHQGAWDSADLTWDDDRGEVLAEVRTAHQRGLESVLVLRVDLDADLEENRFLWHGMIQPRTEDQLGAWFDRYRAFVLGWARIAEDESIPTLMIGAELNALASTTPIDTLPDLHEYFLNAEKRQRTREQVLRNGETIDDGALAVRDQSENEDLPDYLDAKIRAEADWARAVVGDAVTPEDQAARLDARRRLLQRHWIALVAAVREVYSGRVGYAANFDQFREVGFWSELDVLGINAYFPLRRTLTSGDDPLALYPDFVERWSAIVQEVDDVRRANGVPSLPVLFTELGYTRRAASTIEPWADTGFAIVPGPDGAETTVVWRDQPLRPRERALAVRALGEALDRFGQPLLDGILWWKLSTLPGHHGVEAFLLVLGEDDPTWAALRQVRRRARALH